MVDNSSIIFLNLS